ncbi:hypothetical protein [Adlercreutzia equolifaciens]|uniref:hypothetical protein n=1 Tax=Adlercreutzia equolifaciens TaxID=446660 RepID=UPI003A89071A
MCHRFEMVSGEEADAVLDWLRAVRRALASGAGAATVVPPAFGRPVDVPFDALDCYPGAESSGIVMEGERVEGDLVSDGEGGSFAGDCGGDLARIDLLWGVDVSWKRGLVFNARIESALSGSGLWSDAVEGGRCIVPVRAFYETRNVENAASVGAGAALVEDAPFGASDPAELTRGAVADVEQGILGLDGNPAASASRRPRGRKSQYRFSNAGGTALLLAGLRLGDRFVLVTCEPDAVVGHVHSRMPLSLTAPEALAWLDRSTDARDLLARHVPVPLESQEEPAPTKRPADPDQMSLF